MLYPVLSHALWMSLYMFREVSLVCRFPPAPSACSSLPPSPPSGLAGAVCVCFMLLHLLLCQARVPQWLCSAFSAMFGFQLLRGLLLAHPKTSAVLALLFGMFLLVLASFYHIVAIFSSITCY